MRAVVFSDWKTFPRSKRSTCPDPGPGEVLLKVAGAGACHSDVAFFDEFESDITGFMTPPFVLGHETSGWIEALGPGVEASRWALLPGVRADRLRALHGVLAGAGHLLRTPRRGRLPGHRFGTPRRDGRVHDRAASQPGRTGRRRSRRRRAAGRRRTHPLPRDQDGAAAPGRRRQARAGDRPRRSRVWWRADPRGDHGRAGHRHRSEAAGDGPGPRVRRRHRRGRRRPGGRRSGS